MYWPSGRLARDTLTTLPSNGCSNPLTLCCTRPVASSQRRTSLFAVVPGAERDTAASSLSLWENATAHGPQCGSLNLCSSLPSAASQVRSSCPYQQASVRPSLDTATCPPGCSRAVP